jgi:diguanylate cyclase (GGDEF)-like protein
MVSPAEERRVVLAASADAREHLQQLFGQEVLAGWEAQPVASFAQARFLVQHEPVDLLVVDEGLYLSEGPEGLAWLTAQRQAPVVFLAGPVPEAVVRALDGVEQWLPRDLAVRHPELLLGAMNRAVQWGDLRRRVRQTSDALQECRRQVTRLVGLLWESSPPTDGPALWFSQRLMMERLLEEAARAERHGTPFAVALGEVRAEAVAGGKESEALTVWTAEQVQRAKRRTDVAGRYGPNGFMLLLVQTPQEGAAAGCQRLQAMLEQPSEALGGPHGAVRAYLGVAAYSANHCSPKSLLSTAEKCLESAKAEEGERVVVG